jgi:hypothetical protein
VRGLDLYALVDGEWLFVGAGQPNGKKSRNVFIRKMNGEMREYIMYLPLYDGVINLSIGGAITEIFSIISIFVAMIRLDFKKK